MSLLSTVEHAINSCRAQQTEINDSIQLYREILQSLTPQPKTASDEAEGADAAAMDRNTSPREKEDMELLEQALEKALQVRTGSGTSKGDPGTNKQFRLRKEPDISAQRPKDVPRSQSTSKSASSHRKEPKKPGPSVSTTLGSRPSARTNRGQPKTTKSRSKIQNHTVSSAEIEHHQADGQLRPAGSASDSHHHISPLSSEIESIKSHMCGAHSLPQNDGISSDQITNWKSLRIKQNRLWDKVIALQRNSVPGRGNFMERISAMFPVGCGRPDGSGTPADKMTHSGPDLAHHCQTTELLAKPPREAAPESESEARDQWRPEGGRLCPTGANEALDDGRIPPLPLTVTYTTEAELQQLENLRMRMALLQQETQLEQALLDTLSPQLSSITPGPGCPAPSVLRDMYSLLGEGGERFPATVLDCESD